MNDNVPGEAQRTELGAAEHNADSPAQAASAPVSTQPVPLAPQAVPQPWPGQLAGPAYPTPYAPLPYAQPLHGGAKSSRPGLVIAVISLIVSGIALLAVVGMAAFMLAGPAGMMAPLTGQVPSVSPSTSLSADRLSSEITVRMEDDGWVSTR